MWLGCLILLISFVRQARPVVESAAQLKLPTSTRQELNPTITASLSGLIVVLVVVAALIKCGFALSPQMIDRAQHEIAPVRNDDQAVVWTGEGKGR